MDKPNLKDFYHGNLTWLVPNTIFLTLHGSHAYGTSTPTSDVDVKGIAIPPAEYYLGFNKVFEQAEFKEPDGVVYELRKFFRLARDCNPNIIEVLNTDESDWIGITPLGRKIMDNRDLFISMKAKHTFSGYAHAQLKRINTHYRWLKNPPTQPPTRETYGLPAKSVIPMDQLNAAMTETKKKVESWDINWDVLDPAETVIMKERLSMMMAEVKLTIEDKWIVAAKTLGFDNNFIYLLQQEQGYKQKCADWDSYQEWKKSRNPQRSILEEKYGYDTKHGMHLVRLMKMCREIITTGKIIVKRPDAEELLSIRNGAWSYDELIEWSDKQELELSELYKTCRVIRMQPDNDKLDALCAEVISEALDRSTTKIW
jgi:hypothetical protein